MFAERAAQVRERVAELIARWEARNPGERLPSVDVRFDLRGRVAGQAGRRLSQYYMRFNRDMMLNESWDHMLNDTVPHELAHIICFANGTDRAHGPAWRATCVALGGSGDRCHSEQVTYAKGNTYIYTTTTGHTIALSEIRHRKVQSGKVYIAAGRGKIHAQCQWSLQGSQMRPVQEPVQRPVPQVQKPAVPQTAGASKADAVRAKIAEVKAQGKIAAVVVQWAVDHLGMTAAMARRYVKNNWNKV